LLLLLLLLLLLDDLDAGDVFDEPLVLFAGVVVTGGPLDMSAVVPSALAAWSMATRRFLDTLDEEEPEELDELVAPGGNGDLGSKETTQGGS
jgi:hypothetical protein